MIPQGSMPKAAFGLFAPSEMLTFPPLSARGEGSTASRPIAHPELIVTQISESTAMQNRLRLDRNELAVPWTLESALANSIELPIANLLRSTSKRSLNMSPMKGSNYSVDSHDGPGTWGVDVEGLREALGEHFSRMLVQLTCALIVEGRRRRKSATIEVSIEISDCVRGRFGAWPGSSQDASRRCQGQ
jgi:hypothetical protein